MRSSARSPSSEAAETSKLLGGPRTIRIEAILKADLTKLVEELSLFRIAENFVSPGHVFESLLTSPGRIPIGMELGGKLAVGTLDRLLVTTAGHPERGVWVFHAWQPTSRT